MDVAARALLWPILAAATGASVYGALQGLGFTTQWFDYGTQATTDALSWTIGAAPSLDMATVSGETTSAEGRVVPNIANVIRFEYQ